MPIDDAFARHDMAVLYDSFNRSGADSEFYLGLVDAPSRILDLGCGTGALAIEYAQRGHQVTGLEPGAGMLSVALGKQGSGSVRWVAGDAREFDLSRRFDLIVMTGHVFQVFLDDDETHRVLANARRHLAAGGRLVFESRNPLHRAWESWTENQTLTSADVPGIGDVDVYYQTTRTWDEFVTFDAVFTLKSTGERLISESTLRFPDPQTIAQLLHDSGFGQIDWIGDWDGSAFSDDSPEIIVIATA